MTVEIKAPVEFQGTIVGNINRWEGGQICFKAPYSAPGQDQVQHQQVVGRVQESVDRC